MIVRKHLGTPLILKNVHRDAQSTILETEGGRQMEHLMIRESLEFF